MQEICIVVWRRGTPNVGAFSVPFVRLAPTGFHLDDEAGQADDDF